ncbi:hypothetical protein FOCC_FOCC005905 [Frankliniella occidentalis]|nr:hypothetical protein FOCC_FOCC005905 [Frankliniella occidentalis]
MPRAGGVLPCRGAHGLQPLRARRERRRHGGRRPQRHPDPGGQPRARDGAGARRRHQVRQDPGGEPRRRAGARRVRRPPRRAGGARRQDPGHRPRPRQEGRRVRAHAPHSGAGSGSRPSARAVRLQRRLLGPGGGAPRLLQAGRPAVRRVPGPGRAARVPAAAAAPRHHHVGAQAVLAVVHCTLRPYWLLWGEKN